MTVWMHHNCVNGDPAIQFQAGTHLVFYTCSYSHEGVARLRPTNLFILPSPYQDLNNYLFASFTKFWDLIDDEFLEKGGLAPYNLIKPSHMHIPNKNTQSDAAKTPEKEENARLLAINRSTKTDEYK